MVKVPVLVLEVLKVVFKASFPNVEIAVLIAGFTVVVTDAVLRKLFEDLLGDNDVVATVVVVSKVALVTFLLVVLDPAKVLASTVGFAVAKVIVGADVIASAALLEVSAIVGVVDLVMEFRFRVDVATVIDVFKS